jgi:tetratricopeptide (TPR) repeat protein
MKNRVCAFVFVVGVSACANAEDGAWNRFMERGSQLEAVGNFASAAATYGEAFNTAKGAGNQLQMGIALSAGAGANGELGLLMDAERDYCRALQLLEKTAGKDSLIYAKVSTSLAWHYLDRGETRLAETTIRPAIAVYEKSPPPPGDIRLAPFQKMKAS